MSSTDDSQLINGLFDRLQQAEQQSGERDQSAAQRIDERVQQQPAAPYYMAQTILIQEAALKRLNERVERLEKQLSEAQQQRSSGSFLSGLFGGNNAGNNSGGARPARSAAAPARSGPAAQQPGWGANNAQPQAAGGGRSFLSGALQTATGVAGGVVLGNMLSHMFSGHSGEEIVNNDASNFSEQSYDEGYDQAMQDDAGYDDVAYQDPSPSDGDQGFDSQDSFSDDAGYDDFGGDDFV
ncbi:hypothetical protein R84981_000102 [Carnimonas sp. R-84981]|uniref:DUF2076 domain-containing protein n=1 Tax=Carnimonas bestiolae TaxID=3402172 RepID=UPI003EDC3423